MNWTKKFSGAKEIYEYLYDTCKKYNLFSKIKFDTKIVKASWDDELKIWKVETESGQVYTANFLINGTGALNIPKKPMFKNHEKFQGKQFHSLDWDHEYDISNKKVAVVGTGASAVQIVPSIEGQVKHLSVFQRSPCWSPPRLNGEYTKTQKWCFQNIPAWALLYRFYLFVFYEMGLWVFATNNARAQKTKMLISKWHKRCVKGDADLAKKLTPDYMPGCKRMTPSDGYLKTFNKEHVDLVTDEIQEIVENGIMLKNGKIIEVDCIVWAIGFDMKATASPGHFKMFGKGGQDLETSCLTKEMGGAPYAYLGISNPGFPNYFRLLGAGTGLAHNSAIYMIECQITATCEHIEKCVSSGSKSMELKSNVIPMYVEMVKEHMKNKNFGGSGGCTSWYRNADQVNWTLWPRSVITYWWYTLVCDQKYWKFE